MKMSDITNQFLSAVYKSGRVVLFRSRPGCGKTERVFQFTDDMELGRVVMHLTSIDAPDFRGYAVPSKNEAGEAVTKFTLPPLMEAIRRSGKERGVVFLDEFAQADHLVQKAAAPAMSERLVGEYLIPDGWVIWAASNRASDKAGVNRMLGHVTNRIFTVEVEPDVQGWLRWADDHDIHPLYKGFAQARPGLVFDADSPSDPTEPFISPRSFVNAHAFHMECMSDRNSMTLPNDPIIQEFISGGIGSGAATEFFSYIKVANELPKIEEILKDPMGAKVPGDKKLDAQYAAAQLCVHHADTKTVGKLFKYVTRLNRELQTSTITRMSEKGKGILMNSPELNEWLAENAALVTGTFGKSI